LSNFGKREGAANAVEPLSTVRLESLPFRIALLLSATLFRSVKRR
jgi:hypothetical protein